MKKKISKEEDESSQPVATPLDIVKKLKSFFEYAEIDNLVEVDQSLLMNGDVDKKIAEVTEDKIKVQFYWYDSKTATYSRAPGLKEIVFDRDIDISDVVFAGRGRYGLSYEKGIKQILEIPFDVEKIDISRLHRSISGDNEKIVNIPYDFFIEVRNDAGIIYHQSKRYKSSTERYLINQFREKHTGNTVKDTTHIEEDEFDFLVHRLNLKTKKKKEDYEKYLSKKDILSLQDLFTSLLNKEVFEDVFIRKLDDYFIREKLKDIIAMGKDILSLKSGDIKTQKAAKIIKQLQTDGRTIKQLENVWQVYFNKYLLYLVFSYREIYQKVKLDLDLDKKYPDFLGINHFYGIDIFEIKTHLAPVLTWDPSHKGFAFSSEISKAISQTMNYIDAVKRRRFKSDSDRKKVTETTFEENLYNPRGIIIISSYDHLVAKQDEKDAERIKRDFTKLRCCLHGIEILTFDEILNIAENYLEKVAPKRTNI